MNNMFKKECPSCRQNIFYCCERNLERSIRNNNFCRKCFVKKIPIESYKKAAKTRKLLGHDKKSKESKVKMVETRRRNDPNHLASKKCWETRRKNGTDKRTPEMNIKTWETRQKNGKDKQTKEEFPYD